MAAIDADRVLADLRELRDRPARRRRAAPRVDAGLAGGARLAARQARRAAGVTVDRDEAGNLWATAAGRRRALRHRRLASRRGAERRLARRRARRHRRARRRCARSRPATRRRVTVRLVDWADEEGARFGRSLLGSSAAAGTLEPDDVRDLRDARARAWRTRCATYGVDLDARARRAARLDGALAYLELHIEQGPVLDRSTGRSASAVSGTFGDERYLIRFTGQAAHAGSTPMRLRRDALAAAATARARDPRGRHPPRRRLHRRRDARRARASSPRSPAPAR